MGKIVGEPYRGKPDVRFDEGLREGRSGWRTEACRETGRIATGAYSHRTEVLLY
jgi:hypothetical protein